MFNHITKKKIKRVCFLNPQGYVQKNPPLGMTDTGGQIVYILELAKALARSGIKVDIVTRHFQDKESLEEISPNVRIIRIPCGSQDFIIKEKLYEYIPEFVENFVKFTNKQNLKYDLLHSHYWDGGYAGIKLAKKLEIPHVFTPHSLGRWKQIDMEVDEVPVANLRKLYRYQVRIATEQKIMDRANIIMMLSEGQRIKLLQYYLVDFEKIKVIYPGVDTRVFNCGKCQNGNSNGMTKKNRILIVSRFAPAKGIDRAMEIFSLVTKKIDCTLYLATSMGVELSEEEIETKKKVEETIAKNNLKDKVRFLGFIPDRKQLAEYYKKTDIFLLPSRYEPFGLTTLEAMACGKVTFVSRVAGSKEIIVDGVNGFIIDMHERVKVAKKILEVFENPKLKKLISSNALLTIQKHYSWDIIGKQIVEAYSSLL